MTASPAEINKARAELRAKVPNYAQNRVQFDVKNFPTRTQAINFAQSWRP